MRQGCSRLHQARCPNREKSLAGAGSFYSSFQCGTGKRFSKPDYVRAQESATVGAFWHILAIIQPGFGIDTTIETAHFADAAMQFDYASIPCPGVESIHILGEQAQARDESGEFCQGVVPRIGFHGIRPFAPQFVPIPHQFGIGQKSLGRSQVFWAILRPQADLGITKGAQAAFLRNARTSQDGDMAGCTQK